MRRIRHDKISDHAGEINTALRGHYAYYGVAENLWSLVKVYRVVERYWRKMLCSRSWAGRGLTWDTFHQIKERTLLQKPKLRFPYGKLQVLAVL
jgi:RNA-directed DNA polymerase